MQFASRLITYVGAKVRTNFWIHNMCNNNKIVLKVIKDMAKNTIDIDNFKEVVKEYKWQPTCLCT